MKGSLLAVFGPDGSGKSTVVKNLVRYYKSHARDVVTLHWRPGLLPYKLRSHPGSVSFTDPHGHHIRRGLKGLMILFYIFVDFLLGHIFVVLPAKRKGKIVIYERYFIDILIDQIRYGLETPVFLRKLLVWLLPEPDFVVLLDAPAAIIAQRKRELSVKELALLSNAYKEHLKCFRNYFLLDVGSKTVDETVRAIVDYTENGC